MKEFSMTELIAFIVVIVTITVSLLNAFSYGLMRMTENYKQTDTKIDDRIHRFARILIKMIEKFNNIFAARY